MKFKIVFILALSFFNTNLVMASTAVEINSTGISEGINGAVNGSYGARNAASCGRRCGSCCVNAVLGFAQLAQSLMTMMQNMGSRDALSSADWANLTYVPDLTALPPQDRAYMEPIVDAIQAGDLAAYERARAQMMSLAQPDIDRLADMGYSFDEQGNVTLPPGTPNPGGLDSSNSAYAALQDSISSALSGATIDSSGGGGLIMADGAGGGGAGDRGLASLEFGAQRKSSVDSFLNKLDNGKLDDNKLVGMSKLTRNGDAIGVAMGNLFKTIHVKYKNLDTKKEFK